MQGRLPLVSFSPLDLWSLWFSSCCELTGGGGSAGREEERSVREELWKGREEDWVGRESRRGGVVREERGEGGRVGGVEE